MTTILGHSGLPTSKPHLQFIDCLRGYAALMVITTHLTYVIAELPYPISRFTKLGWYGVQLFFLMSAFTLLASWNNEKQKSGKISVANFFIRRYLRIAPAFYLGALLYYFVRPPQNGFDPLQLLAALTFTNGWHPDLIPTDPSQWMVVPGGWSIAVEFSFYALFPILASLITSSFRAIAAVLIAIAVAIAGNLAVLAMLFDRVPLLSLRDFLYFWLPDQLPVFLLGFMLYYAMGGRLEGSLFLKTVRPYRYLLVALALLGFCAASYLPLGHFFGDGLRIPETLYIAAPLSLFVIAIASGPTIFVNRAVQEIGKVSLSAYLLQFAVLDFCQRLPGLFGTQTTGMRAILHFVIDWPIVVAIVFLAAALQYRLVELPMMNLARRITKRHKPVPVAA
jgi:peptidoglycan/LPS O-acetylase OafA/YrhL